MCWSIFGSIYHWCIECEYSVLRWPWIILCCQTKTTYVKSTLADQRTNFSWLSLTFYHQLLDNIIYMGVMFCPTTLDSLWFYFAMLWMIFLPAAALKSGENLFSKSFVTLWDMLLKETFTLILSTWLFYTVDSPKLSLHNSNAFSCPFNSQNLTNNFLFL